MQTTTSIFEIELRRILKEEIEKARSLLETAPFDSVGAFEAARQKIRAFREVENTLIDEAKTNADKRIKN